LKNRIRSRRVEPLIDSREFYTVEQIADLLNINEMVIYRSAKSGWLPSHQRGGLVRFNGDDVKRFVKKRRTSPKQTY